MIKSLCLEQTAKQLSRLRVERDLSNNKGPLLEMARLSINCVCLIGIVIGVVSAMGAWIALSISPNYVLSPEDSLIWNQRLHSSFPDLGVSTIFIAGLLLAILTPIGGFIQLLGLIFFISTVQPLPPPSVIFGYDHAVLFNLSYDLTAFYFMGLASSLIVIFSLRFPIRMLRDVKKERVRGDTPRLSRKLLTFSIIIEDTDS